MTRPAKTTTTMIFLINFPNHSAHRQPPSHRVRLLFPNFVRGASFIRSIGWFRPRNLLRFLAVATAPEKFFEAEPHRRSSFCRVVVGSSARSYAVISRIVHRCFDRMDPGRGRPPRNIPAASPSAASDDSGVARGQLELSIHSVMSHKKMKSILTIWRGARRKESWCTEKSIDDGDSLCSRTGYRRNPLWAST